MKGSLIYLSYGPGGHVQEIVFSILSARYFLPGSQSPRIVVYTDDASPFADLNVAIEPLSQETLADWLGGFNYIHRRKILTMQHALRKYGTSLLLDSDTYFTASPDEVLARITPTQSVMHMREGPLKHLKEHHHFGKVLCSGPYEADGKLFDFSPSWAMWNSGVMGIHQSHEPLLEQVIALNDAMQKREINGVSEQVAFARVLQNATKLVSAEDKVFHYWRAYLRTPFSERITGMLPQLTATPMEQRPVLMYPHRPRPDWKRHLRSRAKTVLHGVGITHVGLRSNG